MNEIAFLIRGVLSAADDCPHNLIEIIKRDLGYALTLLPAHDGEDVGVPIPLEHRINGERLAG